MAHFEFLFITISEDNGEHKRLGSEFDPSTLPNRGKPYAGNTGLANAVVVYGLLLMFVPFRNIFVAGQIAVVDEVNGLILISAAG